MERSLERIRDRAAGFARDWNSKSPFRFVVMDDFLDPTDAEAILAAYPPPGIEGWDRTTFVHQRKKFTLSSGFPDPIQRFFEMTASPEFRDQMSAITGIHDLVEDPELVGGGLHQILRGGFLDVHVDYNYHPKTKLHRRLNLLVYMNKDWKDEYHGALEFWDLREPRQLASVLPIFNRGVIFETNEISHHGHPQPLNTPQDMTRKSMAVYYYTATREDSALPPEHDVLFRQTTGLSGYAKTSLAAIASTQERARKQGGLALAKDLVQRARRALAGKPRENS